MSEFQYPKPWIRKTKTVRRIRLEFKIQDLWIGAFWRVSDPWGDFDLWICLIPCLPIHYWSIDEYERIPDRERLSK